MTHSRIHVALVITELNPGGAEKALTALACGLDRREFDPVVYSLRSRSFHSNCSLIDKLEGNGITVDFLNINHPWNIFSGLRRLRTLLWRYNTDVLQSFMFHANLVGRIAAQRAKVPVVCSGIRVAEHGCPWHLFLDKMSQRKVDSYICVSQSVAEFTQTVGKISADKITVITNGIDLERNPTMDITQNPFKPNRKSVAFIGRLSRQKGLDWLLDTVPFWLENHPDWDLYFIGEGEERLTLENKVSQLHCASQIIFMGHMSNVLAILPFLDLVILPSRWEGMPNAIMEAMAAGLPVCCTNVEGVFELLDSGSHDQVSPIGDEAAWIANISRLLDNEPLRQRLGRANQAQIGNHFDIRKKTKEYEELWKRLLAQKTRK